MEERRTLLLDTAIDLVGTEGMRGLTHRAVDAAAGLPAGSTSNVFRTREALVHGIAGRFVTRERAMAVGTEGSPSSRDDVTRMLTAYALAAVGDGRTVALARYALLVEAAQRPELRAVLVEDADGVNAWAADLLRRAGSSRPVTDASVLGDHVTGLVLHQLALPRDDFDPAPRIAAVVAGLGWEE